MNVLILSLLFGIQSQIPTPTLVQLRSLYRPSTATIPELVVRAKGNDFLARIDAISALGELGAKDDESIAALVTAVGDPNEMVRNHAIAAVVKIGEPALVKLEPLFSQGVYARAAAFTALSLTSVPTTKVLATWILNHGGTSNIPYQLQAKDNDLILISSVQSKNLKRRNVAADFIFNRGDLDASVKTLIEMLETPNDDERESIEQILSAIPNPHRHAIIEAAKQAKSPRVRHSALNGLSNREKIKLLPTADESIVQWLLMDPERLQDSTECYELALPLFHHSDSKIREIAQLVFSSESAPPDLESLEKPISDALGTNADALDEPILNIASQWQNPNKSQLPLLEKALAFAVTLKCKCANEIAMKVLDAGEANPAIIKVAGIQILANLTKTTLKSLESANELLRYSAKSPDLRAGLPAKLNPKEGEEVDFEWAVPNWYVLVRSGHDSTAAFRVAAPHLGYNFNDETSNFFTLTGEKGVNILIESLKVREDNFGIIYDYLAKVGSKFPKARAAVELGLSSNSKDQRGAAAFALVKSGVLNERITKIINDGIDSGEYSLDESEMIPLGEKRFPFMIRFVNHQLVKKTEAHINPWIFGDLLSASSKHPEAITLIESVLKSSSNDDSWRINRKNAAATYATNPSVNADQATKLAIQLLDQAEPPRPNKIDPTRDKSFYQFYLPFFTILEQRADKNPVALAKLIALTSDANLPRRIRAIEALGRPTLQTPSVKQILESLLADSERKVRFAAANALLLAGYSIHDIDEAFGAVVIESYMATISRKYKEIVFELDQKTVPESDILTPQIDWASIPRPGRVVELTPSDERTWVLARDCKYDLYGRAQKNWPGMEMRQGDAVDLFSSSIQLVDSKPKPRKFTRTSPSFLAIEDIALLYAAVPGQYQAVAIGIASEPPFTSRSIPGTPWENLSMRRYETPFKGQKLYGLIYGFERLPGGRIKDVNSTENASDAMFDLLGLKRKK